jgi:cold shock CspA family protein
MQGTVCRFDVSSGDGAALLDDGTRVSFGRSAVAAELRFLRVGQRVRLETEDGALVRVQLVTLH